MDESVDVVIVGGGPSGLVALKEMMAVGLNAILVEKGPSLGGYFSRPTSNSQVLTVSNRLIEFSDFPLDSERESVFMFYPTVSEYHHYLCRYALHFGLSKNVLFDSEMQRAEQRDDGGWLLTVQDSRTTKQFSSRALIVATGANQEPKSLPASLKSFQGNVVSPAGCDAAFTQSVKQNRLRVLVVGGGETAADIASDLALAAPGQVSVLLRRPIVVGGRFQNRRDEMFQVQESRKARYPLTEFLETYVASQMSAKVSRLFRDAMLVLFWKMGVLQGGASQMCLEHPNPQAAAITKTQRMFEAVEHGNLELIIAPKYSARGSTIKFEHKQGVEERLYDVVVCCTGYTPGKREWLKIADNIAVSPRDLYLHCFPAKSTGRLFFLGLARPQQGGIPAMSEILSRYIAQILCGAVSLPVDYETRAVLDKRVATRYYSESPELETLVDYNAFLESVARKIGCEPQVPLLGCLLYTTHTFAGLVLIVRLLIGPRQISTMMSTLIWVTTGMGVYVWSDGCIAKWLICPRWPVWYRQRGPGARADLLDHRLSCIRLQKDIRWTFPLLIAAVCMTAAAHLQLILSLVLFAPHKLADQWKTLLPSYLGGMLRPRLFVLHSAEWRVRDLFAP